jgi:hypothetical protein
MVYTPNIVDKGVNLSGAPGCAADTYFDWLGITSILNPLPPTGFRHRYQWRDWGIGVGIANYVF